MVGFKLVEIVRNYPNPSALVACYRQGRPVCFFAELNGTHYLKAMGAKSEIEILVITPFLTHE